jgi:hypothetical protein
MLCIKVIVHALRSCFRTASRAVSSVGCSRLCSSCERKLHRAFSCCITSINEACCVYNVYHQIRTQQVFSKPSNLFAVFLLTSGRKRLPIPSQDLATRPANTGAASHDVFPEHLRVDSSLNTADRIQEQLLEDGHRVWGFVVYRCTYGDEHAWETCLERIHALVQRRMGFYNALDMLDDLQLTVFDDAHEFDHASTHTVREHFKEWRKHAVPEEQGTRAELEARRGATEPDHDNMAVRYKFCIQIDESALRGIVSTKGGHTAWVNLIEADWDVEAAAAEREQDRREQEEDENFDPEDLEDCAELFREIDGCTDNNIGWMRVRFQSLIPGLYAKLRNPYALEYMYVRPPDVLTG